jgi:hypothetical protein
MSKYLCCVIVILLSTGCAKINSTGISYLKSDAQRVFIWKSNYSAGMGTNRGICAQGALTAMAANTNLKIDPPPSVPKLEFTAQLNQAIARINSSNNQTAFANNAYFYLCQISLNSVIVKQETDEHGKPVTTWSPALSQDKLLEMWNAIAKAAPMISANATGLDVDKPDHHNDRSIIDQDSQPGTQQQTTTVPSSDVPKEPTQPRP